MKNFLIIGVILFILIDPTGLSISHATSFDKGDASSKTILNLDSLQTVYGKENKRIQKLIQKLDGDFEKHGSNEEMLRIIFYRAQQLMLNKYVQFSSFNELIQNGSFDCVSGTTLYALILDRYDFKYDIKETSFHVFLIVHLQEKEYIMESTSPLDGFIEDEGEIENFISKYEPSPSERVQQKISEKSGMLTSPLHQPLVYNSISLEELIGLQFFNRAISHYNQEQFFEAYNNIIKAKKYYASERLLTLSKILEDTVENPSE